MHTAKTHYYTECLSVLVSTSHSLALNTPAVEHGGSVSGPWAQHFHTTHTRKYTHNTFWQQKLAKSTNMLRTSDEQFLGRPVKARLQQHKVQLPNQSFEFELVRIMCTPSPMGVVIVTYMSLWYCLLFSPLAKGKKWLSPMFQIVPNIQHFPLTAQFFNSFSPVQRHAYVAETQAVPEVWSACLPCSWQTPHNRERPGPLQWPPEQNGSTLQCA